METENCTICLDPIIKSTWIDLTGICCNTRIHLYCLEENRILNNKACPHCRFEISTHQLLNVDVNIPDPDSDIFEIDSTNATTVVDSLDLEIPDFENISETDSLEFEIPNFDESLEIPDFEAGDTTDNSSEISSIADDPQDPDWNFEDFIDSDDSN